MRFAVLLLVALATQPAVASAQSSRAAQWLVGEAEASGCNGGRGRLDRGSVIERDLTGDGRDDLIIDHNGMRCDGSLRAFCGASACSVLLYVREGDLLQQKGNHLANVIEIGAGAPPVIRMTSSRAIVRLQWNGAEFVRLGN